MNERLMNEIEDLSALDQVDAEELADAIVDAAIDVLRRDLALPKRSTIEWNQRFRRRANSQSHLQPR